MVIYNENDIEQIAFELKNKKALICPTDTVNALICKNETLLFKIKKRMKTKKIILFIPNLTYVKNINSDFKKLATKFWPGQLTLIYNNISYRIPNDQLILNLLEKSGPLYATSANLSGKEVLKKTIDAYNTLNLKEKIILVDGISKGIKPSTIYNINNKKITRQGDISKIEIENCLK